VTRAKISQYSATAGDNTDVNGVNIAEGCPPSSMNNMGREIMAALKRFQVGSDGDGVTVGGSLVVSGSTTANTFSATQITASGTIITAAGTNSAPAIVPTGDTNTGIFFPAADQVAIATNGVERVNLGNSAVVFNDAGADVDFRVEGDTNANLLFVDAGNDRVGIGTSSPGAPLEVAGTIQIKADSNGYLNLGRFSSGYGGAAINGTNFLSFQVDNSDKVRIDSSGRVIVGANSATPASSNVTGAAIPANGAAEFSCNGGHNLDLNRLQDGELVRFRSAGTAEGNISVSGNTVSYNPFLGSHAGALTDWSRPEIKVGTVMDTINELLEYKVVVIDVQEDVPAKDAVLDEESNEVEPAQEATTQTVQKRISYNGNGAVNSIATVEYEGEEYTGTIQHEREEPLSFNKHLKVKINDTAASKTVFGVFVGWNNDPNNDGGVYNDMLVGAVGNYVIRMAAGQTPEAGDLVEADGNGCAVVQDDDIIRTKTIAKVTSTIPQVTYDDGSFLVTCVLYCG
jgi:hypothetical protein